MKPNKRLVISLCTVLAIAAGFLIFTSISSDSKQSNLSQSAGEIAQQRGLSPADVNAALKTYVPTGKYDDYIMFSSGGHSGQVLVIGVPSMRLLKVIAAFTPEPWQGFGTGSKESAELLESANMPIGKNRTLSWADTHHPALSETNGDYDGKFLFINDKANARIAVIDLRDFEVKQMIKSPNLISDHGSTFVTPNTEYVIQGAQYATPIPYNSYAPIEEYQEKYRGMIGFYKFNRKKGRIDMARSFQIEVPPYWQDLCDAGKKVSEGWVFCGSLNSEMATGGFGDGKPPFEAGVSQRDMDYLHVVNWKKAEKVVAAGKAKVISGIKVISLQTAIDEGLLYFVPEPKSPHGADVSPDGNYIVISGKLDTHATIFGFDKIQKAIASKNFEGKDPFGVPILDFNAVKAAQLEIGLGPLHTQFDDQGYAYTSVFIESTVAKWTLGGPYHKGDKAWKLVEKMPVHYNIGHLVCAEGDTVSPDGKYCVSLNKWAIDRFTPVGPLHPQNFQLIDVSGSKMQLLYDMPIGIGEPHYVQMIKADKLNPWLVYPEVGYNPATMSVDPNAAKAGKEGIVRNGNNVEVNMTAIRSHFNPEHIKVKEGDHVTINLTSIERARDATHGFAIDGYNINLSLEPGESSTVEFVADKPGVYPFYCTEFCSALHLEMAGYLLVEPKK
ncbi:MAG: Sec-dependent nitrous-oxide reductase [Candidatus Dadabacteria bacterium]|nr:Sec-dependent nitrous-oxide reductase [Candidatus Dadabacteria bacterium]NIS07339.1 Sec-dependent nitrous-oxide reductase [Candidatus Dadabacteria bacterium]NIV41283.1 Sec-dependent nitrous-oxide reductase [Candidatus Dadabacteria bacterium]NIX14518.1 Sec-dependent nitrous-oxide reductase [Candidatus Dadabacteria bacterium]NIY20976.1 Sec-dependent nitrous-oxide reductase [Candidatus Dadabacteria bacterium]